MDKEETKLISLGTKDQEKEATSNIGSQQTLAHTSFKGFAWNLSGSVVKQGLGFIINIVLARLLGPEPYGMVALATIVISIGNLIVDSGLNSSIVQKKELDKYDISYVFTLQMILGVIIYAIIAGLAPIFARLLNDVEITNVLRVLSLTIIFQSLSQTSLGILKRNLSFKKIELSTIISYLVGYLCIGIPLALAGSGVWSLVIAQVVQSLINLMIVYINVKHPIVINFKDKNGVHRFGLIIFGTNIANWIASYFSSTLIGKQFGSTALGLFNRSRALVYTPGMAVIKSSQKVIFSSTSRIQDSFEKVRNTFLGIYLLIILLFFPLAIAVYNAAEPIILIIYGTEWINAVPFLKIIALTFPFWALMAIEGPTLAGLGRPKFELYVQWIVAAINIMALIIAAQFSLIVVLWTTFGIGVFRFFLLTIITFKNLRIKWVDIESTVLISIIISFTVFVSFLFAGNFISEESFILQLLAQFLLGTIEVAGYIWAFRKKILTTSINILVTKLVNVVKIANK
ncbi:MAG: lipopolysaccharide biosynthesis protein [Candidatus Helarchaeota archaeon]